MQGRPAARQCEVSFGRLLAKKAASLFYLHHPNECFQLVNVKLEVHPVGQPGADDIHGAVVPLLKERQKFSRQHVMEGRQLREGTDHIRTPALLQRKQDGQTESEGTEDHDHQVTQMRCWFSLDQGNVGWKLNMGPSDYTQHIHGAFLKTVSGALGPFHSGVIQGFAPFPNAIVLRGRRETGVP